MRAKPVGLVLLAGLGLWLFGVPAFATDPESAVTSELTKYRCYTHDVIAPRWYQEISRNRPDLRVGRVKISFTVHSDGSISNISVVTGESAGLLKTVCLNVLHACVPFKPFNEALIKEMGHSYVDDFTFTYGHQNWPDDRGMGEEPRVSPPPSD